VRDLVSMAAAATERCSVWPKTAAQDVKCARAHCRVQDPVARCRIQSPSLHFSGHFRETDSRKRRTVIRYLSYCQSPVIANNFSNFSNQFLVSRCCRSSRAGAHSTDVLHSLKRRNQSNTCVRPITSSPYACCNN